MNNPEQAIASAILVEVADKLRTNEYASVQQLTSSYHNLCLAYEVRVRAELQDPQKQNHANQRPD